ncbi:alkaline phosphatase [Halalkalibacter krulwichiae]|uniref:Alkaline phosphatase 4 n=1 Tax=Halalkalibacter krulwichiae TaxID=199441 RepID=A0A1X9MEF8_9BACI|nr:alkaline phosphatase [Halalkalibacter krulwichiae]ARK31827.1 Alkaline phosphatase 4 precursor [Halalkalibacter krulwichiae]
MSSVKKAFLLFLLFVVLLPSVLKDQLSVFAESDPSGQNVKNVILMIPDGFSSAHAANYRIFKEGEFVLDSILVGMMKTHSKNSWVTDSAAAGTAMATGVKTRNGFIGIDEDGNSLKTILEAAKEEGKGTGLVGTKSITDATPAAFATHVHTRQNEGEIARQLMNKVDVLLGGGERNFLPASSGGVQEQRNLIKEAESSGYTFVQTKSELAEVKPNVEKLLGLFADNMMAAEIDRHRTEEPSLQEMTETALALLRRNNNGFFLMVEGSKIDRAGHAHDPAWVMHDIAAFESAVITALEFAEKDGETLVVVAGDHDTGGMSVGGYDEYRAEPEMLRKVEATAQFIAQCFNSERTNISEVMKQYTHLDVTKSEINELYRADIEKVPYLIAQIVSRSAYIDWVTYEHTGVDVPIYAYGPRSSLFQGVLDNTDLPKRIAKAMKINF